MVNFKALIGLTKVVNTNCVETIKKKKINTNSVSINIKPNVSKLQYHIIEEHPIKMKKNQVIFFIKFSVFKNKIKLNKISRKEKTYIQEILKINCVKSKIKKLICCNKACIYYHNQSIHMLCIINIVSITILTRYIAFSCCKFCSV